MKTKVVVKTLYMLNETVIALDAVELKVLTYFLKPDILIIMNTICV